jgi:hypothetical protein
LKSAAWLNHCKASGLAPNNKVAEDAWYRKELIDGLGIWSSKEVSPKDPDMFDRLCLRFATISGDAEQIAYWTAADERRAIWRLEATMKNAKVGEGYVVGIARNMGFLRDNCGFESIKDLPAEQILKINTAVFIYMKRHQKQEVCK